MRYFKLFLLMLALLPALSSCNYNSLVEQKQGVEQQWAEVQNQYQRRADLRSEEHTSELQSQR